MDDRERDNTLTHADSRAVSVGAPGNQWALTVLHSPSRERIGMHLPLSRQLRLGRVAGPEVDLAVDDPRMSRVHATITRAGLIFEVHDLGSRNGSYVNGERVESRGLGVGDIVRLGDTLVEIGPLRAAATSDDPSLVGRSPVLRTAVEIADRVAASDIPVLLLGETGVGKDVLARHIHARSRRQGSFLAVNCAALPRDLAESMLFGHRKGSFTGATTDSPGFFAQAEDGTLFLDEVGELPLHQQAKLLRVLESHEYVAVGSTRVMHSNARVVAATNANLEAETAGGGFRADLYARLAGAVIRLPPLRARRGDILALAEKFLADQTQGKPFAFSANAAEMLLLHHWPHNVRGLRTAMQRLALLQPEGGEVSRRALETVVDAAPEKEAPAVVARDKLRRESAPRGSTPDRDELVARLTALRGNVNRIAEEYGKDPKQVYRWLKRYDLDPEVFR